MGIEVAIAAAAVGTAISAGSAVMQGQQQAKMAEAQAAAQQQRANFQADQQVEQAAVIDQQAREQDREVKIAGIQAEQQANARRERLRKAISAQTAAAAGQGVAIGQGGSLQAVRRGSNKNFQRDMTSLRFMGANETRKLSLRAENTRTSAANARKSARFARAYGQTQAGIARQQGQNAKTAGYVSAAGSVANGAFGMYQTGLFQSPGASTGGGIKLDGRVFPGAGHGGVT